MPEEITLLPKFELERLVDILSLFRGSRIYSDTFIDVLTDFPPDEIAQLSESKLDEILAEIRGRPNVNEMQANLRFELSGGEGNLDNLAYIVTNKHLRLPVTIGDKPKVYTKPYQDIKATCDACFDHV